MPQSITALLRSAPLFADLSDAELDAVAALARPRSYGAKQVVVRQGDPTDKLFLIVSGHLKAVTSDPDGRDTALSIMGPGEVCGEVSLLDGGDRSASMITLDPCELLSIDGGRFFGFLESTPAVATKLLRVLAKRLRNLTERSEDIAFLRVGGRLARRIVRLADEYGEVLADGSVRVAFRLSQQEIGDLVGATRESANKQLKAWEQEGLLSQEHGHLVIHDMDRLRHMSDPGF